MLENPFQNTWSAIVGMLHGCLPGPLRDQAGLSQSACECDRLHPPMRHKWEAGWEECGHLGADPLRGEPWTNVWEVIPPPPHHNFPLEQNLSQTWWLQKIRLLLA